MPFLLLEMRLCRLAKGAATTGGGTAGCLQCSRVHKTANAFMSLKANPGYLFQFQQLVLW